MTHPLTLWLAELLGPDEPDALNRAQNALVGLFRHPEVRERHTGLTFWPEGCEALAREIEEASRG